MRKMQHTCLTAWRNRRNLRSRVRRCSLSSCSNTASLFNHSLKSKLLGGRAAASRDKVVRGGGHDFCTEVFTGRHVTIVFTVSRLLPASDFRPTLSRGSMESSVGVIQGFHVTPVFCAGFFLGEDPAGQVFGRGDFSFLAASFADGDALDEVVGRGSKPSLTFIRLH